MDIKLIGKKIAKLRKQAGYTQDSLAEKLQISSQAISKWETGSGLPEASLLVELSELLCIPIDEILKPEKQHNTVPNFINRTLAVPHKKILEWVPRISRWHAPAGCDMWYSFPASIAEALVCIEAREQNRFEISYDELNERFCDLMHITGMGYGFLWNVTKRYLIEELWHVNNISEMINRVMGYYGRDYLWLTSANTTIDEMRRIIIWSIAQGRPVVMEGLCGIPEFNVLTGYEELGETLIGYTYCEECAAATNEHGMFINPARWEESWENGNKCRVLIVGDKTKPTVDELSTIKYALAVLEKHEVVDKEFISGDDAYNAWLDACDTTEHTIELCTMHDIFTYALYMNSIYSQKCVLPYYKKLGARNNKHVNDIAIQIDIALGRIVGERSMLNEAKKYDDKFALSCKEHIKNLIKHRDFMRGWLRDLSNTLDLI